MSYSHYSHCHLKPHHKLVPLHFSFGLVWSFAKVFKVLLKYATGTLNNGPATMDCLQQQEQAVSKMLTLFTG